MLPFVENRILSVVRCHNDVNGEKFFKKHPQGECEGVKIVNIKNSEGEKEEYFCAINEKGLISEAQLGTIEFHTWGSRFKTLEKPDIMVFDLDPDEKIPLSQVRQGVRDLKVILNKLNLKSFLKTSGGKGYHILVPFKPSVSWEKFYDFAKKVALVLESNWPERYTTNIRKNNRKNKIFIDYMRNGRASTSVAPYSLRARPDGGVSMPILWKELDEIAPNQITMEKALERIKERNPWGNFFKISQELKD